MKAPVEFNPLGELPAGWSWQPLQNLTANPKQDVVDGPFGSDLKASEYVAAGVPIARLQNIDRNTFVAKNIRFLTHEKAADLSRHEFRPNDILITKLGDPLGKACIVPASIGRGVIVADLVRVRPDESRIDRQYLTYAINSPSIIKQFELHTKGTTRPRVNLSVLRQLPIPVAPREVQDEIVAELEKQFSRLDEAVANLQRVKANLKRYKASVLKAAVEGRLVETEATLARREGRTYETGEQLLQRMLEERRVKWAGRGSYISPSLPQEIKQSYLPEGWAPCGIDHILPSSKDALKTGPFGSLLKKHEHQSSGIQVLGIENIEAMRFVKGSKISITPEKASQLSEYDVRPGDVLVSRSGTVGEVCVVPPDIGIARISTNLLRIRLAPNGMKPEFFVLLFNGSPLVLKQVADLCKGSTRDFLNQTILKQLNLLLPPFAEQRRILDEVDRHLSIIREVEAEVDTNLKRAQALRQATLSSAFSGG